MVVAYYTSTNFLDVVLETIQGFKTRVELHIFIEITNVSKNTTIINVENLEPFNEIETPERLLGTEKWNELRHYFDGVASVQFLVHKDQRSLTIKSLKKAYSFGKFLKKYHVDVFHFDTISPRAIGLYLYLKAKRVFITLHDPVPHSGETNWREHVPNFVFYGMADGYFFYSHFAERQFGEYYKKIKAPFYTLKLQPYSFISQFLAKQESKAESILFFGRLSYYKGIDILLDAIPKVLEKFPNQKFVIAGKPVYDFKAEHPTLEKYKKNIEMVLRYITVPELVHYLEGAKFAVCPYRDATQSGVLMTCMAAGKTVVATRVGSFPEYITDGVNGFLADPEPASLSAKIIEALEGDRYLQTQERVASGYSEKIGNENGDIIIAAYKKALKKTL